MIAVSLEMSDEPNFFDIESIFLSVFYYKDKEKYRYIKI